MTSNLHDSTGGLTGIFTQPWPFGVKSKKMSAKYQDNLVSLIQIIALKVVAEEIKGSPIDRSQFEMDVKEINNILISQESDAFDNVQYLKENYDQLRITVKDLDQFKGIDFKTILFEVMQSENICIDNNQVILVDKDYLAGLNFLKTHTKR